MLLKNFTKKKQAYRSAVSEWTFLFYASQPLLFKNNIN